MRADVTRFRAAVGVLLLAGIVLSWGVILLHGHADGQFRPSCPACQQERVVAGHPTDPVVGPLELAPVFLPEGVGLGDADIVRLEPVPSLKSPRSPPLPALSAA
ncbi:MAG: hypothetical protein AB1806_15120 [Acidobacteriota bacterium]